MKTFASYIGYLMGVLGFAGVIWTYATKSAEKEYDVATLKKDVTELSRIVTRVETKMDTASIHYVQIEKKQTEQGVLMSGIISNQDILKVGFVKHLELDERYLELVRFLQNYQFDLKKAVSDTVQFNILIKKIEKRNDNEKK